MNPIDIHRLQVLNDLVAQTIDIINQRNLAAAAGYAPTPFGGGHIGGGLSHTPFNPYVQQWGQQWAQSPIPTIVPQYGSTIPWGVPTPLAGLSHTPFVDPRWAAYAQQTYFPMMPFVR